MIRTDDASDTVLWEVEDGVATLTLNRPETHNAQNLDMERRFQELLVRADDDPEVRAIIITGVGRSFSVGGDATMAKDIIKAGGWAESIPHPMAQFGISVRKPVVAAINGACAGGGLVWAISCDVRFAARGAKLSAAFPRRGCVAERGLSWTLPRLVGVGHASDLLLSGRTVTAEEAATMGLVNRAVAPEDLMAVAREWAVDAATNCAPTAMATIKRQLQEDSHGNFASALARAADEVLIATTGAGDFREGFMSFLERRPATFSPLPPHPGRGGTFTVPADLGSERDAIPNL
ncbi:enoyl-CoA hydratase-related protein [Rhodococcus sp. MSC1_016]|jgi:enoyl-CoA hydratase/carnithine racemase|uniref:enoyl-CoA hydratase-related protein n=1 Tax=Rhodococcus sp. MSC1_016 TaxID=2909266 RepID=UPI00202EC8DD|nr:enoyl-CoA hydratase-related protein [Rhodococcus sp. MSC1_016]